MGFPKPTSTTIDQPIVEPAIVGSIPAFNNMQSEPVQQPIVQQPESVQTQPEPVQQPIVQQPEPVQTQPEPVQTQPEPVQQPIVQQPEPVQTQPEPVQQPIIQQPEPVQTQAKPDNIQSSPLTTTFTPQNSNNNNIITNVTPAKFDGLLKVLNLLTDSNDPIIISKSQITKNLSSGAIVSMDVNDVFEEEVDLHIVNPKKNIKLFKTLKNNNNIYITEDDENSRYIIMNGEVRLFLPKQDESIKEFESEMPSLEGVKSLASIKLNKETKTIIAELATGVDYVEYLFQDDQMKAIHIPETAIYIFEDFIHEKQASKLDETNADLALRSTSFLPITADNYDLNIGQLKDGSYCSYIICDTGYIKVNIFEELEDTTGGSIF